MVITTGTGAEKAESEKLNPRQLLCHLGASQPSVQEESSKQNTEVQLSSVDNCDLSGINRGVCLRVTEALLLLRLGCAGETPSEAVCLSVRGDGLHVAISVQH